ncbi:MAG: hypothetical protein C5B53_10520 [Candidatus Melainabacteria bacterium]|nr:MAG: hypothetical protein C5B53_10520 [Candidatus Melainabacteria bacterium]
MAFDDNFGRPGRNVGADNVAQRLSFLVDAFGLPGRRVSQVPQEQSESGLAGQTSFCSLNDDPRPLQLLRNRLRDLEQRAEAQHRRVTMVDLAEAGFTPENLLQLGDRGTATLLHRHNIEVNIRRRMVALMTDNPNITPQQLLERLGEHIPLEGFPPGNPISRHPGLDVLALLAICRFDNADVPAAMQNQVHQNAMAMLLLANHNNWNQAGAPAGDAIRRFFGDASLFRSGQRLETYLGALDSLSPNIREAVRTRWRDLYRRTLDDVYPLSGR